MRKSVQKKFVRKLQKTNNRLRDDAAKMTPEDLKEHMEILGEVSSVVLVDENEDIIWKNCDDVPDLRKITTYTDPNEFFNESIEVIFLLKNDFNLNKF